MDNEIYKVLGAEGIEELRKALINVIVEQVREDLANYDDYIVDPEWLRDALNESIVESVVNEVKDSYKDKIAKAINKKLEGII